MGAAAATPAFLERIAVLLADPDRYVRGSAAAAVGKMGAVAATPAILERIAVLLADRNEFVRQYATDAVGKMGAVAATLAILEQIAVLLDDLSVRELAAEALVAVMELGRIRLFRTRIIRVRWKAVPIAELSKVAVPADLVGSEK